MITLTIRDKINFSIPIRKRFNPVPLDKQYVDETLRFAFDMTYGKEGQHRNYRSGGSHRRKNGEIFCDTFQGKLAEFFVYQNFTNSKLNCPKPDLEKWGLGKWDDADLVINKKLINIKSMAFFSNLLLLETKDWDASGKYIPNEKAYDFFVIVRLKPDLKSVFMSKRMLYTNNVEFTAIKNLIIDTEFEADIPGYIPSRKLIEVIKSKQILPKGAMLNGKIKMDAENYYIISEDFENFINLKRFLAGNDEV